MTEDFFRREKERLTSKEGERYEKERRDCKTWKGTKLSLTHGVIMWRHVFDAVCASTKREMERLFVWKMRKSERVKKATISLKKTKWHFVGLNEEKASKIKTFHFRVSQFLSNSNRKLIQKCFFVFPFLRLIPRDRPLTGKVPRKLRNLRWRKNKGTCSQMCVRWSQC